jgi:hypothetical protein
MRTRTLVVTLAFISMVSLETARWIGQPIVHAAASTQSAASEKQDEEKPSEAIRVYLANGALVHGLHEVVGTVQSRAYTPGIVTLEGAAQFSKVDSYSCLLTPEGEKQTVGAQVVNMSRNQFAVVIYSTTPQLVVYRCIGF